MRSNQSETPMTVTRPYPRGGVTHPVGATLTVPEAAAVAMETANPPYGTRTGTAPTVTAVDTVNTPIDATPKALDLAAEHGLDLRNRTGDGPNGRIRISDVRRWLAAR